jgi:hypothetical protein
MAIAIPRRKSIKVGERRSALIELPHVQSYEIEAKWDPIEMRWDPSDLDGSSLKRDVTGLTVKGVSPARELKALASVPVKSLKVASFRGVGVIRISLGGILRMYQPMNSPPFFRHCEETGDGYVFFNEDDTV